MEELYRRAQVFMINAVGAALTPGLRLQLLASTVARERVRGEAGERG